MKPSYVIAILISVVIVIWFAVGGLSGIKGKKDDAEQSNLDAQVQTELPSVKIKRLEAESHENFIQLHGRTEPVREVSVKAETAGLIVRTPIQEGRNVKTGAILCEQDIDARQAQLDQANAALRSRELEYDAAKTLVEKGFRSSTQALGALAALDGAKASVKRAEIELGNVIMRAPFDGIFEQQIAEIGDYLSPGQPCGLLVDLDPIIVTGEATEQQISSFRLGEIAAVELATGESLSGKVRYIEARANPATRTFKIEVEVPNKSGTLKAGVTANLKVSTGEKLAHFIPSSVLTLDDSGRIGVRYIDADKVVHFALVTTIDETVDGIWVTGLPKYTDLIILGQDFVSEGIKVTTQYDLNNSQASGTQ